ncbi:MAG: hypothetical protein ACFCUX_09830, partial [Candidatus Methylacidiphilales bacterium]
YGKKGECHKFALEASKKHGADIYTRIFWHLSGYTDQEHFFKATGADWPMMKAGFERLLERWPDSTWNKTNYCLFACLAKDRETARRLFDELGNDYIPNAWNNDEATYRRYRKWAYEK